MNSEAIDFHMVYSKFGRCVIASRTQGLQQVLVSLEKKGVVEPGENNDRSGLL